MDGPAKVGNLDIVAGSQEQVLGFDVSVNDVLGMAVFHCHAQIGDEAG